MSSNILEPEGSTVSIGLFSRCCILPVYGRGDCAVGFSVPEACMLEAGSVCSFAVTSLRQIAITVCLLDTAIHCAQALV